MSLSDVASQLFTTAMSRLRREILGIVIAAVCAVGALFQAASAAVSGLEPYTGLALAHLCVTIGFIAVGALALAVPRYLSRRDTSRALSTEAANPMPRRLQMAAIIEALLFGFSLAQRPKQDGK